MNNIFQPENATDAKEKILTRVAKLIAKAEGNPNEHEREAYLAKADSLMTEHRITLAQVEAKKDKSEKRSAPISVEMDFAGCVWSPWQQHFLRMWGYIARNCRIRSAVTGMRDGKIVLVGFEDDVEYAQMIWMSVHFGFVSKLDPTWDDSKSADENIKALKESGRKWAFIADVANQHGFPCTANDGKLKAAYRRQCKREGVEPTPHTQRNSAYRQSFADYFQSTVIDRLNIQYTRSLEDEGKTTGAEVALRSRESQVDEEFYAMYPDMKPRTREQRQAEIEADRQWREEQARLEEIRRAGLTQAQRDAEDRQRERERIRRERWEEEQRAKEFDAHGAATGRKAGRSIDLSGGKNGLRNETINQIGK